MKNESSINISHQGISFLNSSRKVTFLGQYRHLKMSFLRNHTHKISTSLKYQQNTHTHGLEWYHLFMTSVVSCEVLNVHLTFNHPLNLGKIVSMRALEIKLCIWHAFWKITACLPAPRRRKAWVTCPALPVRAVPPALCLSLAVSSSLSSLSSRGPGPWEHLAVRSSWDTKDLVGRPL